MSKSDDDSFADAMAGLTENPEMGGPSFEGSEFTPAGMEVGGMCVLHHDDDWPTIVTLALDLDGDPVLVYFFRDRSMQFDFGGEVGNAAFAREMMDDVLGLQDLAMQMFEDFAQTPVGVLLLRADDDEAVLH